MYKTVVYRTTHTYIQNSVRHILLYHITSTIHCTVLQCTITIYTLAHISHTLHHTTYL